MSIRKEQILGEFMFESIKEEIGQWPNIIIDLIKCDMDRDPDHQSQPDHSPVSDDPAPPQKNKKLIGMEDQRQLSPAFVLEIIKKLFEL